MEPEFESAITVVLANEGGFQDDPNDAGNWTGGNIGVGERKGTNMGISAAQYPDEDIKNLTVERAKDIYYTDYWKRYNIFQIKDHLLATKLLDMAVLMGDNSAVRCLQRALRACGKFVTEDGQMGKETLTTANDCAIMAIVSFRSECAAHFRLVAAKRKTNASFLNGWLRRAYS